MIDHTYIGTREHPRAGLLLKVGISTNPDRRARELGLTIHALLPTHCEAEIHRLLWRKRVWTGEHNYMYADGTLTPVFPAHTEWFYIDPALGEWIRTYIAFIHATDALLAP